MKVVAYKGTGKVENTWVTEHDEINFTRTVNAYGETIGEFYDNLLLATYSLKEDLTEFGKERYGSDWNGIFPTRSRWYVTFTVPRIITSDASEESMNSIGRSIAHVNDVLFGAFLCVDFAYQEILSGLRTAGVDYSRIPQFEHKKTKELGYFSNSNTFSKLRESNYTGADLDDILNPFIESGEISHIINEVEKTQKQSTLSREKPATSPSRRFFSKVLETIGEFFTPDALP